MILIVRFRIRAPDAVALLRYASMPPCLIPEASIARLSILSRALKNGLKVTTCKSRLIACPIPSLAVDMRNLEYW